MKIRQIAYDGAIRVWGRRDAGGLYEEIPKEYWRDHNLNWFSLLRGEAETDGAKNSLVKGAFKDLMVSRAEIEKEMPYVRQNG